MYKLKQKETIPILSYCVSWSEARFTRAERAGSGHLWKPLYALLRQVKLSVLPGGAFCSATGWRCPNVPRGKRLAQGQRRGGEEGFARVAAGSGPEVPVPRPSPTSSVRLIKSPCR